MQAWFRNLFALFSIICSRALFTIFTYAPFIAVDKVLFLLLKKNCYFCFPKKHFVILIGSIYEMLPMSGYKMFKSKKGKLLEYPLS